MTCLEFRKRISTDPWQTDPALRAHAAECPACAREAKHMREIDARLREGLNVSVPADLEARILLAQSYRRDARGWLGLRLAPMGMTAVLVLTLGLAGWMVYQWRHPGVPEGLPGVVLNHINDELMHLHEDRDVQPGDLARLFGRFHARLRDGLGHVSYAGRCNIRQYAGAHLVVSGRRGPVTVLVMPREFVTGVEKVRSPRFQGVIVPTEFGSIAVVGEKGEPVSEVLDRLRRALQWDAPA